MNKKSLRGCNVGMQVRRPSANQDIPSLLEKVKLKAMEDALLAMRRSEGTWHAS